jgi:hypothetical protein
MHWKYEKCKNILVRRPQEQTNLGDLGLVGMTLLLLLFYLFYFILFYFYFYLFLFFAEMGVRGVLESAGSGLGPVIQKEMNFLTT